MSFLIFFFLIFSYKLVNFSQCDGHYDKLYQLTISFAKSMILSLFVNLCLHRSLQPIFVFLKVMVGDKGSHPIVFIPDLSEEVLELILGFMYKGEITVPSHLILPLMEAARLLGVQGRFYSIIVDFLKVQCRFYCLIVDFLEVQGRFYCIILDILRIKVGFIV